MDCVSNISERSLVELRRAVSVIVLRCSKRTGGGADGGADSGSGGLAARMEVSATLNGSLLLLLRFGLNGFAAAAPSRFATGGGDARDDAPRETKKLLVPGLDPSPGGLNCATSSRTDNAGVGGSGISLEDVNCFLASSPPFDE